MKFSFSYYILISRNTWLAIASVNKVKTPTMMTIRKMSTITNETSIFAPRKLFFFWQAKPCTTGKTDWQNTGSLVMLWPENQNLWEESGTQSTLCSSYPGIVSSVQCSLFLDHSLSRNTGYSVTQCTCLENLASTILGDSAVLINVAWEHTAPYYVSYSYHFWWTAYIILKSCIEIYSR